MDDVVGVLIIKLLPTDGGLQVNVDAANLTWEQALELCAQSMDICKQQIEQAKLIKPPTGLFVPNGAHIPVEKHV